MAILQVPGQLLEHLEGLSLPGGTVNQKLVALLEAEYGRRLSRYSLTDRLMAQKYGMSFEEFEREHVTERDGYSWEVESDAAEWDLAISGIQTVRRRLAALAELARDQDR